MRFPILIASGLVITSLAYRYFAKDEKPSPKIVLSWAIVLTVLSILGKSPLASLADIFTYLIIVVILLNDGYDIMRSI